MSKKNFTIKKLLIFTFVGPLVPITILSIPFLLVGETEFSIAILVAGYLIGIIPSFIAALLFYFFQRNEKSSKTTFGPMLLGAICGAIPGLIFGALIHRDQADTSLFFTFLVICIIAGSVCGKLVTPSHKQRSELH